MGSDQKANLTSVINAHQWFHVRPDAAPACYRERGRFYAATYDRALEYGKPYIQPDRLAVNNPLIGDEEETDLILFGEQLAPAKSYRDLCWQESRRKRRAKKLGFDSILLLPTGQTAKFLKTRRIPASAELCLIDLDLSTGPASVKAVSAAFCTSGTEFYSHLQAVSS